MPLPELLDLEVKSIQRPFAKAEQFQHTRNLSDAYGDTACKRAKLTELLVWHGFLVKKHYE
jgi:hypothetical protein